MKPLSALLILIITHAVVLADEPPPTTPRRAIQSPVSDAEDAQFRDPFASESEQHPQKRSIADPLQSVNRAFFRLNNKLYFWVLKPVAKGYNKVAPEPFRQSIRRLFVNARYPVRVVNNLLQGKFKGAGIETARFVVNSTVGIGGLFDPAQDEWRLRPYPEELDQTFGFYGVPTGIYLYWPVFGPSSVRGTVGMVGDSFLSPWNYVDVVAIFYGSRVLDTVNATSLRLGEYEDFKKASFDPYLALRDAYVENRRSLIKR